MHSAAFEELIALCCIEEEEVEDDDADEAALNLLIAVAGQTVADIKAMATAAREAHAQKCDKERHIAARAVAALAEKMGCPAEKNTKLKRLQWVFTHIGTP